MARSLVLAIACGIASLAIANTAHAQSETQRGQWAADCAALGGKLNFNTGRCDGATGGGAPGGGFSANQQAMLNLAGQFGSLLGSAIRQSFEQSARQAEIDRIQREWEAEQARQRAIAAEEEQRRRNAALLANMKGAIGSPNLQPSQLGGGQLKMRTTKDMFDTAASPAPGSLAAYSNALQKRNAARGVLDVAESDLAVAKRLVAEAERNAADHPGPDADRILGEARAIHDKAYRARDMAKADLDKAEANLKTAAGERDRALNPNTDPSVVDLRGARSTPALLRDPPWSQPGGLPRLAEVENSPGRAEWKTGMQAAAGHNWEQATTDFEAALARDPKNPALEKAVDLAQWTRDFYRRPDVNAAAALRMPKGADPALRVPKDEDLELLYLDSPAERAERAAHDPGQANPELSRAFAEGQKAEKEAADLTDTPEERARRAAFTQIGEVAPPEDIRLAFNDPVKDRADMVASIAVDQRQRLTDKGAALPAAHDWSDRLAPEVRGMLAELREALPPRTYGPRAPNEDLMRGLETEMANAAGDEAVARLLYGDLEGVQHALAEAEKMNPGFHKAYGLIEQWRSPVGPPILPPGPRQ